MIGAHDHTDGHDHGHAHDVPSRVDPVIAILASLSVIIIVATTPRGHFTSFAAYGVVALLVLTLSPVSWKILARRILAISITALFAAGPLAFFDAPDGRETGTSTVLGVTLSHYGLAIAFRVWAVGVLSVSAITWLGSVTPAHEILVGLRRLRCPALIVALVGFVQRFGGLISEEASRMLRSMRARGHNTTWAWRAAPLGGVAGSLFLRSLGRAERVHGAMRLRGWGDGSLHSHHSGLAPSATPRTTHGTTPRRSLDTRQAILALLVVGLVLAIRVIA